MSSPAPGREAISLKQAQELSLMMAADTQMPLHFPYDRLCYRKTEWMICRLLEEGVPMDCIGRQVVESEEKPLIIGKHENYDLFASTALQSQPCGAELMRLTLPNGGIASTTMGKNGKRKMYFEGAGLPTTVGYSVDLAMPVHVAPALWVEDKGGIRKMIIDPAVAPGELLDVNEWLDKLSAKNAHVFHMPIGGLVEADMQYTRAKYPRMHMRNDPLFNYNGVEYLGVKDWNNVERNSPHWQSIKEILKETMHPAVINYSNSVWQTHLQRRNATCGISR